MLCSKSPAEAFAASRLSQAALDAIYADVLKHREQAEANLRVFAVARDATGGEARAAGASSAPATNRGGKSETEEKTPEIIAARLELEDGKILEIPARRTWGGTSAFIDWVNFTADERAYFFGTAPVSDNEVMDLISHRCKEIFGFGITSQRATGANFYDRSYILGEGYGVVCHGGQRGTVLVMLSGEGCAASKDGWHERLHEFLSKHENPYRAKLTRVDLAHDIYDGKTYNVDKADHDFDTGLFNCGGRNPNHEYRGNWKRPTGKGRTLYIGTRSNGKFCRIYEKGRQLGDKTSEWVRVEVEMKAVNRYLPLDILLQPGQYLAASYPALGWISQHQERIVTTQKKTEITYQTMCDWLKRQAGAAINVLVAIEGSAEKAIEKVIRDEIPARLKLPMWQTVGQCIHETPRTVPNPEIYDSIVFA